MIRYCRTCIIFILSSRLFIMKIVRSRRNESKKESSGVRFCVCFGRFNCSEMKKNYVINLNDSNDCVVKERIHELHDHIHLQILKIKFSGEKKK